VGLAGRGHAVERDIDGGHERGQLFDPLNLGLTPGGLLVGAHQRLRQDLAGPFDEDELVLGPRGVGLFGLTPQHAALGRLADRGGGGRPVVGAPRRDRDLCAGRGLADRSPAEVAPGTVEAQHGPELRMIDRGDRLPGIPAVAAAVVDRGGSQRRSRRVKEPEPSPSGAQRAGAHRQHGADHRCAVERVGAGFRPAQAPQLTELGATLELVVLGDHRLNSWWLNAPHALHTNSRRTSDSLGWWK